MSSSDSPENVIPSPCVGVCVLDHEDICEGCLRSGDEIRDWNELDIPARCQVLARMDQRWRDRQG